MLVYTILYVLETHYNHNRMFLNPGIARSYHGGLYTQVAAASATTVVVAAAVAAAAAVVVAYSSSNSNKDKQQS